MNRSILITLILLLPSLILFNTNFSAEQFSLNVIRKIGDRTSAEEKLQEIGLNSEMDYENFRLKQLTLIFLFVLIFLIYCIIRPSSPIQIFGVILLTGAFTIFYTERALAKKVVKFRDCIESEFPAIVEMMTLALSAGETPVSAMQRIANRGCGSLAKEFSLVVAQVKMGTPFYQALDGMGKRIHSISVRRFVDALVIAINRGAPLIDVLHSQSNEARSFQRNRILSAAGKSEISMMIPVVFLILPISILFALWPSLTNLNLFASS